MASANAISLLSPPQLRRRSKETLYSKLVCFTPLTFPPSYRQLHRHATSHPISAHLKENIGAIKKTFSDFSSFNYWVVRDYYRLVNSVNALEPCIEKLSDEQLMAKTAQFRLRLSQGETLAGIQAEAFGVVREAAKRKLGMRHFDVQIIGGVVLHDGSIGEMKTGEGKTLVSTLVAYLNSLSGNGVHCMSPHEV